MTARAGTLVRLRSLPVWVPVLLLVIRIRRIWVPIPIVLLWPLLVLVWLLAAVAAAVVGRRRLPQPWPALWQLWCLFGAARGLRIDVRSARHPPAAHDKGPKRHSGARAPAQQPRIYIWVA